MATAASLVVLVVVLGLVAWGRVPDVLVGVPAALAVLAFGLVDLDAVGNTFDRLGPTLAFLAAIFVFAEVARDAGIFDATGAVLAARSGTTRRLVVAVSAAAVAVTVLMSLDATAVLFTPVVIQVVRTRRVPGDPPLLATVQLANASSSLLPVSNLTNLLVFSTTGLTFGGFALRMLLPTAAAVLVVVVVIARRTEQAPLPPAPDGAPAARLDRFGWFVLGALGVLIVAFFAGSEAGIDPAWIAGAGAVVVGVAALARGRARPLPLLQATAPQFLLFVLALAVVVDAAVRHGLGDLARDLIPHGAGLPALLAMTGLAALLANLLNNLPATLVLTSVIPGGATATLLAMLIGVNVGPNLTYTGSLATLLWRRVVRGAGVEPGRGAFFRFALLTTPAALVASAFALWATLQVVG
ncbi:MAG: arsenical pump rane protein [Actinomycetota bacterium]|nr:arsenical pump rane protein [Actinomycetota bacterium]